VAILVESNKVELNAEGLTPDGPTGLTSLAQKTRRLGRSLTVSPMPVYQHALRLMSWCASLVSGGRAGYLSCQLALEFPPLAGSVQHTKEI
jgi:hypothetical protein